MEEKNDIGIRHPAHEHSLILNENYIARKGDVCCFCGEQIDSCKSFVYSCGNISSTTSTSSGVGNRCRKFLLHKTCAELPPKIVDPTDKNQFLYFYSRGISNKCMLCSSQLNWFVYDRRDSYSFVCIRCAVLLLQQSRKDPKIEHPGHSHPLALIEHPSSFKCYACKVNNNVLDCSYRCTECQFWMHKSCGDAPPSFQFQFHKHPLVLSFSLPQKYQRFDQRCRLCNESLNVLSWLYCCRNCRFFTHFHCARSSPVLSTGENETETDPNLVHLPLGDESSINLLLEKFIKDKTTSSHSYNSNSISTTTNYIKHWSHEEHDLKLMTSNDLYDEKNDDEILLLCDACVKPIGTDYDCLPYYGCVPCKYYMHKVCAELPREIEHQPWPGKTLYANKFKEPFKFFSCDGCGVLCNGLFYGESEILYDKRYMRLHIGCVTLPKSIKHEAHPHQLDQFFESGQYYEFNCNACSWCSCRYGYRCEKCKFSICAESIMKAGTYKHRWDPHPLDLIYDAGMVEEHEHDYDCEFCSREIDTNYWFYHCSKCDLSFHSYCLKYYQHVKLEATDIMIDDLHPHKLKYVLNKKVRSCKKCGFRGLRVGEPVFQCVAPCRDVIFCGWHAVT